MARIAIAVAAGFVALIVLAVTVWFLGDALMLWLVEKAIPPAGAAGLTGLAGLVLAGLLGLTAKWVLRSPRRRTTVAAAAVAPGVNGVNGVNGVASGIAADLGALAAQQIVSTTRSHPYGTMGAALAAGLAVGAVPELRKSLIGLLKH